MDRPATGRSYRILAVGNMYPPHHHGGYEVAWQATMAAARDGGHVVRMLTSDYRRRDATGPETEDVHRALRWYWDLERYAFPALSVAERIAIERRNAAHLRHHLDDFRPDLVSWWSMGCMSLSLIEQVRRRGVPAVLVVHDDWLVYGPGHDQWIRGWRGWRRGVAPVVERTLGVPTKVDLESATAIFNSAYTRDRATEAGLHLRSVVVHPGVDPRFLAAPEARPWAWRLAYVGRIDRQKGIDTAVQALAHLPDSATLAVWGTGDEAYVAELRALAARVGAAERVRFAGFATAERLVEAYAEADAVVFPVRWEEPFGLVPLEAMGMNRPVVTTLGGGTVEFASDGENVLAFTPGDVTGLAAAVARLAASPGLRTQLTAAGRATAAARTSDVSAQATLAAMLGALGSPSAA
jgi:glycosyltransferase involved in cell wall biosynthesis